MAANTMFHLDLATLLNTISTIAIVAALIFTALQVRQGNQSRINQATITVIESSQSEAWFAAARLISDLPADATSADVDGFGPTMLVAIFQFGFRFETIGYLVFRRIAPLDTVNELMGGVALAYWSRAKAVVERERVRTGNPRLLEWAQWLAERIQELRATQGHEPGHVKHKDWRA